LQIALIILRFARRRSLHEPWADSPLLDPRDQEFHFDDGLSITSGVARDGRPERALPHRIVKWRKN
jgi:hypothetical protein